MSHFENGLVTRPGNCGGGVACHDTVGGSSEAPKPDVGCSVTVNDTPVTYCSGDGITRPGLSGGSTEPWWDLILYALGTCNIAYGTSEDCKGDSRSSINCGSA